MVEHRPLSDFIAYAILTLGVCIVVFPVWLAFVASTHDAATVVGAKLAHELYEQEAAGATDLDLNGRGTGFHFGNLARRELLWGVRRGQEAEAAATALRA